MENYFNYFTEIEEKFRACRSEPVLLSPLDWALVETWKEQDFPLEAVLAGIERSFAKFKPGKRTYRRVNNLAYCSQEIFRAVEEARTSEAQSGGRSQAPAEEAPFSKEDLARFFVRAESALAVACRRAREESQAVLAEDLSSATQSLKGLQGAASSLDSRNLESMERNLTALEEKVHASLLRAASVELMAKLRADVDRSLVAYRRKMKVVEIESLERRFLKNCLLDYWKIPRLSLFYL